MCIVLEIPRSTYYYEINRVETRKKKDSQIEELVITLFKDSRRNFGTRKIKKMLEKKQVIVSRRKIGRIMADNGLVSNYTIAHYKVHKKATNNETTQNELNRDFQNRKHLEVVVSDLTYVRVGQNWCYVCLIIDLFNREFIGCQAGNKKDAKLIFDTFATINYPLHKITLFHTDRGSEFKNNVIESLLETFNIKRSLSHKGCPYDNAVAESAFKIFKTEFVKQNKFHSLEDLKIKMYDYVNWYNKFRIHSSLDYVSPVEYRNTTLKKFV